MVELQSERVQARVHTLGQLHFLVLFLRLCKDVTCSQVRGSKSKYWHYQPFKIQPQSVTDSPLKGKKQSSMLLKVHTYKHTHI